MYPAAARARPPSCYTPELHLSLSIWSVGLSTKPGGADAPGAGWVWDAAATVSAGVLDRSAVSPSDPEWCQHPATREGLYRRVQRKYWGVGVLKYWQIKQIPNFALAAPAVAVTAQAVSNYFQHWGRRISRDAAEGPPSRGGGTLALVAGYATSLVRASDAAGPGDGDSGGAGVYAAAVMPLMLLWGAATLALVFTINVQTTTRVLFSGNPAVLWSICHGLKHWGPAWRRGLLWYLAVFNVVGVGFHVNFLPWT